MNYIARKITLSKWPGHAITDLDELSSDALGCIRTSSRKLSVWQCTSDRTNVAEIVLAMAAAPKNDKLERTQIVLLDPEELGFTPQYESEDGDTQVEDLRNKHKNLVLLSAGHMCRMALRIANAIPSEATYHVFSAAEVKSLLLKAIDDGRLRLSDLHTSLQGKIGMQ